MRNGCRRVRLAHFLWSKEVEIYLMLDHPHIAALRDVYETESEIAAGFSIETRCSRHVDAISREP